MLYVHMNKYRLIFLWVQICVTKRFAHKGIFVMVRRKRPVNIHIYLRIYMQTVCVFSSGSCGESRKESDEYCHAHGSMLCDRIL